MVWNSTLSAFVSGQGLCVRICKKTDKRQGKGRGPSDSLGLREVPPAPRAPPLPARLLLPHRDPRDAMATVGLVCRRGCCCLDLVRRDAQGPGDALADAQGDVRLTGCGEEAPEAAVGVLICEGIVRGIR